MAKKNLSQSSPTTPQKPAVKKRAAKDKSTLPPRYSKVIHDELYARSFDIGITAAQNIREISHALSSFMDILFSGDEAQRAIAHVLWYPVDKLKCIVKESCSHRLDGAVQKLDDILDEERKEKEKWEKGRAK